MSGQPALMMHVITTLHLDNLLNQALLGLIVYFVYAAIPKDETTKALPNTPKEYNWRPDPLANTIVSRKWTPKELSAYDGTETGAENGRILFAIRRRVYDVTQGKGFYGPGGPYAIFAGRDATRGMAKQSFESDMLTDVDKPLDTLQDLTPSEWTNLLEWESHFRNKYFVCGELVES